MDTLNQYLQHGIETRIDTTEADGGKLVIRKRADIAPNIEFAKAVANDDDMWKRGVKSGWALAGHIPAITVVELRGIGIDVYKAPMKDIRAGLERLGKPGFIWKN